MGYTHYWYKQPKLDPCKFAEFISDVEKLVRASGVEVQADSDEESPPEIKPDHVRFNGVKEAGHETFYFDRDADRVRQDGRSFDFCKTAHKPYDVLVTAVLVAAKKHFGPDIQVTSDGHDADWEEGFELAERLLGYTAKHYGDGDDRDLIVD